MSTLAPCPYHMLRIAQQRFERNLAALDPEQRARVEREARASQSLEARVLASVEARDVQIADNAIAAALAEVRARYADADAFAEDLALNGLDEERLCQALGRELRFDAVMRRIGARAPAVAEEDIAAFHAAHPERFSRPERREARHLLITINADYAENRRERALARIERLAAELSEAPEHFAELAQQQSECPTALEGGRLGLVVRGQLYPALDAALFALEAGAVSGVLESELGFHLLRCERIEPARTLSLDETRERIRDWLESQRQRAFQRDWIAGLGSA